MATPATVRVLAGFLRFAPPSIDEWLPENPLARFIVEAIERLDTSRLEQAYQGRGSAAYALRTQTVEPVFGIIRTIKKGAFMIKTHK